MGNRRVISRAVTWAVLMALVGGGLVFAPGTAHACSCAARDDRRAIAASDAAFVGRAEERRVHDESRATYTFAVEKSYKGELGSRVEVDTHPQGATCGLEVGVGQRAGVLLRREGDRWASSLCQTMSPDSMEAASRPLSAPDGSGPASLLVGVGIGNVSSLSLDSRSRTRAYGEVSPLLDGLDFAVCPGATRAVEVGREWLKYRAAPWLVTRDLASHSLVRARPVDELGSDDSRTIGVLAASCRRPDASSVLLAVSVYAYPNPAEIWLVHVTDAGAAELVWRGRGDVAAISPTRPLAYVAGGGHVTEVDVSAGSSRRVAALSETLTQLVLAPGGGRLAGTVHHEGRKVVVVDLDTGAVRQRSIEEAVQVTWADATNLILTTWCCDGVGRVRVYDPSLRERAVWDGWRGHGAVVVGDVMVGTDGGHLVSAPWRTGPATAVRDFYGSVAVFSVQPVRDPGLVPSLVARGARLPGRIVRPGAVEPPGVPTPTRTAPPTGSDPAAAAATTTDPPLVPDLPAAPAFAAARRPGVPEQGTDQVPFGLPVLAVVLWAAAAAAAVRRGLPVAFGAKRDRGPALLVRAVDRARRR